MLLFYYLSIKLYGFAIYLLAPFHKKAKLWVNGRKNIFTEIKQELSGKKTIWFHASSYGEFEQGRPVLDGLIQAFPNHQFIITFFSPSAYEYFKSKLNYVSVFYLPLDCPKNAKQFINIVNPEFVVFVKNDFWFYYMRELFRQNIKFYYVSCLFRPSQIYFRWFAFNLRKQFNKAEHFFVQNQASLQILYKNKITQVSVSGDTRFDRVYENLSNNNNIAGISEFKGNQDIFIGGSTWPADEKLIITLANEKFLNLKFIIAPHEVNESRIKSIQSKLNAKSIKYSELGNKSISNESVLIMDNIGYLSSLYKYGKVSFIGGGFGNGIHNILESVTFGVPTIFGPRYKKSKEATELVKRKKAFCIKNIAELKSLLKELCEQELIYDDISRTNKNYILENKGATSFIVNQIQMDYENVFSVSK